MGQRRKRVNRKKKRKRNQEILLAGILMVVGIFVGIKFIPKHQQENVQITNPNDNKDGTSDNTESNNKIKVKGMSFNLSLLCFGDEINL